jgi:hypothetical protein
LSVALNKEAQLSLSDNTKIANHTHYIEKLLEMAKEINNIEGRKGGK